MLHVLKHILYLAVRDFTIFNFPVLRKRRNCVYGRMFSARAINVDHRCRIQASLYVVGQNTRFGESPHIECNTLIDFTGTIEAGDRLTISDEASIFTHGHPLDGAAQDWRAEPVHHSRVKIGNDVWTAVGSIVTKGFSAKALKAGNSATAMRNRDYLRPA